MDACWNEIEILHSRIASIRAELLEIERRIAFIEVRIEMRDTLEVPEDAFAGPRTWAPPRPSPPSTLRAGTYAVGRPRAPARRVVAVDQAL